MTKSLAIELYFSIKLYIKHTTDEFNDFDYIYRIISDKRYTKLWDNLSNIVIPKVLYKLFRLFLEHEEEYVLYKFLNKHKLPIIFLANISHEVLCNEKMLEQYDAADRMAVYNYADIDNKYLLYYVLGWCTTDISILKYILNDGATKISDDITIWNLHEAEPNENLTAEMTAEITKFISDS